MGTREEDGTALEAVAIRFDAGRNRAPGLRAFDQDCTHVDPPVLVPSSVILLWRQVDTSLIAAPLVAAGARSDRSATVQSFL
jgi:hypothetical protein